MYKSWSKALGATVALLVLVLSGSGVAGCRCHSGNMAQTINNYLHSSTTVVRVRLIKDITPKSGSQYNYFRGKVTTVVKGKINMGTILVQDASNGALCGLGLAAGQTWLLSGTLGQHKVEGYAAASMPVFQPAPCMSHNKRWAFLSRWERKLIRKYNTPDQPQCYPKDCLGPPVDPPLVCPDGVNVSTTHKVCQLMGNACEYNITTTTKCPPVVPCTSDRDCWLVGSSCSTSAGVCKV